MCSGFRNIELDEQAAAADETAMDKAFRLRQSGGCHVELARGDSPRSTRSPTRAWPQQRHALGPGGLAPSVAVPRLRSWIWSRVRAAASSPAPQRSVPVDGPPQALSSERRGVQPRRARPSRHDLQEARFVRMRAGIALPRAPSPRTAESIDDPATAVPHRSRGRSSRLPEPGDRSTGARRAWIARQGPSTCCQGRTAVVAEGQRARPTKMPACSRERVDPPPNRTADDIAGPRRSQAKGALPSERERAPPGRRHQSHSPCCCCTDHEPPRASVSRYGHHHSRF